MKKILRINKIIVYLLTGILIIAFHKPIINNNLLYLIIGITTLVLAIEGIIFDIITKRYKQEYNHIGTELFRLSLALVILFVLNDRSDFNMVCICWSIIVILANVKTLNKTIAHLMHREPFVFHMLFAVSQLILAILLISNPEHHATMHLIILGVEFIIQSIEIFINLMYVRKNNFIEE